MIHDENLNVRKSWPAVRGFVSSIVFGFGASPKNVVLYFTSDPRRRSPTESMIALLNEIKLSRVYRTKPDTDFKARVPQPSPDSPSISSSADTKVLSWIERTPLGAPPDNLSAAMERICGDMLEREGSSTLFILVDQSWSSAGSDLDALELCLAKIFRLIEDSNVDQSSKPASVKALDIRFIRLGDERYVDSAFFDTLIELSKSYLT